MKFKAISVIAIVAAIVCAGGWYKETRRSKRVIEWLGDEIYILQKDKQRLEIELGNVIWELENQ
jgi:hypothetical protein